NKRSLCLIEQHRHLFRSLVKDDPHYFVHELAAQRAAVSPRIRALFWSPTPRALHLAARRGLLCGPSPPQAVLYEVFHKGFLRTTGCVTLPGHCFVEAWGDFERLWKDTAALLNGARHLRL